MSKLKFLRLRTLDPECRCCGKGYQHVCEKCNEKLHDGYVFMLEVKDSSTKERKKPTGYAIAFKGDQVKDPDDPTKSMDAGIYFIRQSDLKDFLKDDYNNPKSQQTSRVVGRLLTTSPDRRRNHPHGKTARSSRSVVELQH